MTDSVSLQDAIAYLNDLIELDAAAIVALINQRVPCNRQLAEHETCQVYKTDDGYVVGLLGILNGLFGIRSDGYGHITAVLGDKSHFRLTE
jgi:hypothetical protein